MSRNKNSMFSVNTNFGDSAIEITEDGYCIINKLALLDEKTGKRWSIKVLNGEIIIEPFDLDDKRDFKIQKILD